ncbi:MAG TPA: urate hydroxylase PuuD [Thermoanaerobaculia bacterium]|nr:urate hydroxylase PuuD [Thermoanaerobaculia bacterium]
MPPEINNVMQLFLRWAHVVAGVIWIGHLYFFNWVNAHFAKSLDGPTRKIVIPELMPRALYWFRWGAAWTWITGFLLAGLIYYHGRVVFEDPSQGNVWLWLAIFLIVLAVGFVVYNAVMKAVANVVVANTIVLVIFAAVYLFFDYVGRFGGRSLYMHAGMIFGTIMALNVWMVIWPAQKKIITATKEGTAPDAALVAQAGLRSRHNTFMSVPLLFLMVSNHYPTMYGNTYRDLCLAGTLALGFAVTWWIYGKSAKVTGV